MTEENVRRLWRMAWDQTEGESQPDFVQRIVELVADEERAKAMALLAALEAIADPNKSPSYGDPMVLRKIALDAIYEANRKS